MSLMVASNSLATVSLADVLPSCLAAVGVEGYNNVCGIDPARAVVLFVVDGLGMANIERARGYLRNLYSARNLCLAETVFPSTTASALATLVTGTLPGNHGILGYRVWNPEREDVVNQLSGLTHADVTSGWLRSPSLVDSQASGEHPVVVVGNSRFAGSELTRMLYGRARYISARTMADKANVVERLLGDGFAGVALVYVSELDEAAHKTGCDSPQWEALADELDSSLGALASRLRATEVRLIVTADHGVVDVPATRHIDFGCPEQLIGLRAIAGEPRCVQLYLEKGATAEDVIARWRKTLSNPDVFFMSGAEVTAKHWANNCEERARSRRADVYVYAPPGYAFYDEREPLAASRAMVGQHGGLTQEELSIPLKVLL